MISLFLSSTHEELFGTPNGLPLQKAQFFINSPDTHYELFYNRLNNYTYLQVDTHHRSQLYRIVNKEVTVREILDNLMLILGYSNIYHIVFRYNRYDIEPDEYLSLHIKDSPTLQFTAFPNTYCTCGCSLLNDEADEEEESINTTPPYPQEYNEEGEDYEGGYEMDDDPSNTEAPYLYTYHQKQANTYLGSHDRCLGLQDTFLDPDDVDEDPIEIDIQPLLTLIY